MVWYNMIWYSVVEYSRTLCRCQGLGGYHWGTVIPDLETIYIKVCI